MGVASRWLRNPVIRVIRIDKKRIRVVTFQQRISLYYSGTAYYYAIQLSRGFTIMSITTTGNLGPMILQSLAPAMLYVPTPTMNYKLL
jgi:hypothetical protein